MTIVSCPTVIATLCRDISGDNGSCSYPDKNRDILSGYEQAVAESLGMSAEQKSPSSARLASTSTSNDVAYWRCVPVNVALHDRGHQVIKKWLSYRERALLGRDLKPEEARYVTEMVRRIAALVLMQPELDANYERVKADVWDWGS